MKSTNVRINVESKKILRALASEEGVSMQAVLEHALTRYWQSRILEETNLAYDRLKNDTGAWKEELKERRLWENALGDGLLGHDR